MDEPVCYTTFNIAVPTVPVLPLKIMETQKACIITIKALRDNLMCYEACLNSVSCILKELHAGFLGVKQGSIIIVVLRHVYGLDQVLVDLQGW